MSNSQILEEDKFPLPVAGIRLVREATIYSETKLCNPSDVLEVLGTSMRQFDREVIAIVNLKVDLTPINVNFASVGTIDRALARPCELFKTSILSNAAYMMLIHSHPSGNVKPSKDDITLTKRMQLLCDLMEIPLVDHVIVGGNGADYYSFKEEKFLDSMT